MNIELRKVKVVESLSDETTCFSADVYIDGVKVGFASNRGEGGPTDVHVSREDAEKLTAGQPGDAGDRVDDLLTVHLQAKDLTKTLKRRVLFVRDGKLWEQGPFKSPDRLAAAIRALAVNNSQVLNLLPFGDALRLYRTHGEQS